MTSVTVRATLSAQKRNATVTTVAELLPSSLVPGRKRVVGALALVAALALSAAPAQADKISDLQAQAKALADKRDRMNKEAERLAEQYNQARVELAKLNAQIDGVKAQLDAQDGQLGDLNGRLAKFALQSYMYGDQASGLGALLTSDDAVANVAQRRGYSPVVLGSSVDVADELKAVRQDTDRLKQDLAAKEAKQTKLTAQIKGQGEAAKKASEAATKSLVGVNADLATAVKEEEARRQAELARQAAAEAARRAAELQAQRDAAAAAAAAASRRSVAAGGGTTRTPTAVPAVAAPDYPAPSAGAAKAVAVAKAQLGKPYVFATAGPETYDCSGLTQYAWAAAGVGMDHWTVAQYRSFPKVPVDALQPGDLVFFGSDLGHVGLYIGGGFMVDAPYPGSHVRLASIWTSNLLDNGVRPV